jgi:hypothetical protein
MPSGMFPHSGNIHGFLLALELLGCSDWLLGQEGEVSGCYVADTGFLPVGCSSGTAAAAAAEGTVSSTVVDADVDTSVGVDVLEGDSA